MSNINRRGFTLVELLVVIVVISILIAMLVPAVQAARERARQTQCKNNQKEIGEAIQLYVNAKDHYPGYVNPPGHNWAISLFPHLGRQDLWKLWRRRNSPGPNAVVQVDVLKCPNDELGAGPGKAKLSYVVNRNVFLNRVADPKTVFTPSDMESLSTTIMLSERLKVGPWANDTNVISDIEALTFAWPDPSHLVGTYLASEHPDLVIATFFDGSCKELRITDSCNKYQPGPESWPVIQP